MLKDFAVMDLAVLAARFDEGAVVLVARKTLNMRLVMVHPDYDVVVQHWRLPLQSLADLSPGWARADGRSTI